MQQPKWRTGRGMVRLAIGIIGGLLVFVVVSSTLRSTGQIHTDGGPTIDTVEVLVSGVFLLVLVLAVALLLYIVTCAFD